MDIDSAVSSQKSLTVIASDVSFTLTRGQISVDAPNYFTSAFQTQGFAESSSNLLVLDKDPMLFKYITLYLSGYKILPLQIAAIPITMSMESALENLLNDAVYFDLNGLVAQIKLFMKPPKLQTPPMPSISFLNTFAFQDPIVEYDELDAGKVELCVIEGKVYMLYKGKWQAGPYLFRIKNSELLFVATNFDEGTYWKMEARIPELLDYRDDGTVTTGTETDGRRIDRSPVSMYGIDLTVKILNPEELPIEINGIEGTVYELSRLLWHQDVELLGTLEHHRDLYKTPEYVNATAPSTFASLEHLVCRYKYTDAEILPSTSRPIPTDTSYLSLVASEIYLQVVYPLVEPDPDDEGGTIQFSFVGAKCQTRARAFSKTFFSQ